MSDGGRYEVVVCVPGHALWCVNREHELRQWIEQGGSSRFATDPSLLPTVRTTIDAELTPLLEFRWKGLGGDSPQQALAKALDIISSFPDLVGIDISRLEVIHRADGAERSARWSKIAVAGRGPR